MKVNSSPCDQSTEKKYEIILCDPPWSYRVWNKKGQEGVAENHYPTMRLEDICALPVSDLAAKNCALFLWVTLPNLQDAFSVLTSWGFAYKTVAFVWVKQSRRATSLFWGMGHWTRANAELCLLATMGSPRRKSASVHQIVVAPIEEHSKKPDEVRERIIALMGDLPRVELFARQAVPGWDIWGNEVLCTPGLQERLLTGGDVNKKKVV